MARPMCSNVVSSQAASNSVNKIGLRSTRSVACSAAPWRISAMASSVVLLVVTVAAAEPIQERTQAEEPLECINPDVAAAVVENCQRQLKECQDSKTGSISRTAGTAAPPEWPKGFGKLLRFPFGMSDMKTLKEFARAIWQPDGTAAGIADEVTDRGFAQQRQSRCTSEMVGVHPVGGPGVRWSKQLWDSAQDWCLAQSNCTGIMLYVGKHTLNCHHWCGRPQFCSGQISGEGDVEHSDDWNLFVRSAGASESSTA